MNAYFKSILMRFIRGAVAGAVASMLAVSPNLISKISELETWLVSLSIAGFIGFITGGLLALDKATRLNVK